MYSLTFCVRFLLPERHQWKARIPDCRSNVENAPRRRAGRARLPYAARGFGGAPRRPPVAGRRRASGDECRRPVPAATRADPAQPAVRIMSSSRDGRKLGTRFALCCHSNATRAPIPKPPNSAQLGGSLYHDPKLHPGLCSSVGVRPRTDRHTDRDIDARVHNTFCVVYDSRKM